MKKTWLINPFERIAGWQALGLGITIMALTALLGKINGVAFDGAIDIHTGRHTFAQAFLMQGVDWLSITVCALLAAIIFARGKFRIEDIAGTMALARTPMLILALVAFLPIVPRDPTDVGGLLIFALLAMLFSVWMILLMYNGLCVSCNFKGARAVVIFIIVLLAAEVLSQYIYVWLGMKPSLKEVLELIKNLNLG